MPISVLGKTDTARISSPFKPRSVVNAIAKVTLRICARPPQASAIGPSATVPPAGFLGSGLGAWRS